MTAPRPVFRVIDTGLRGGRANIAFDQALIELHVEQRIPDTIRFLEFSPCVLVGRHQNLAEEVDLAYCAEHGVEVGRRVTGGGGLYLDASQFGWELVFHRATLGVRDLADATQRICEAAAAGLSLLGVPVHYRPRNDLEIDGRKVGGTGGFFDNDTLFYQGTVLLGFDAARMTHALRVPAAKLAKRALTEAAARMIGLDQALGRPVAPADAKAALLRGFADRLGLTIQPGSIGPEEEDRAASLLHSEIGTEDFVCGPHVAAAAPHASADLATAGGRLRVDFRLEGPDRSLIREALITGDFFVTPPRAIFDLEASLRGSAAAAAPQAIRHTLASRGATCLGFTPDDLARAAEQALGLCGAAPAPGASTASDPAQSVKGIHNRDLSSTQGSKPPLP